MKLRIETSHMTACDYLYLRHSNASRDETKFVKGALPMRLQLACHKEEWHLLGEWLVLKNRASCLDQSEQYTVLCDSLRKEPEGEEQSKDLRSRENLPCPRGKVSVGCTDNLRDQDGCSQNSCQDIRR